MTYFYVCLENHYVRLVQTYSSTWPSLSERNPPLTGDAEIVPKFGCQHDMNYHEHKASTNQANGLKAGGDVFKLSLGPSCWS